MLISACKTYTSPKRCTHTKIPLPVCQTASAWPEWGKLMKSVMGYQRGELDICGGEPHLFMGRHTRAIHTHIHQSARPRNCRWGSNAAPMPEQQVDRHFLWCLPSPLFKTSNMRWQSFLPEKDRLGEIPFVEWNVNVWLVKFCQSLQLLVIKQSWWNPL